jgi:hypothetical protein
MLAQTSAATAAPASTEALPVSVRRNRRSGVSMCRTQAVRPENSPEDASSEDSAAGSADGSDDGSLTAADYRPRPRRPPAAALDPVDIAPLPM